MKTFSLNIGLEYVDAIFRTIKDSDFAGYTIVGIKALAVLFFLINILKKYNEGIADKHGYSWGLSPNELAKNFAVVLLVIFSTQILGFFDGVLVAIENSYRDVAPSLVPLQFLDIDFDDGQGGALSIATQAFSAIIDAVNNPLFGLRIVAFIGGVILWVLDLFIYPLFLAERYFLLGIMQAFFPLVISLAVFEKFRDMAYNFFKLYAAVYMIVPAFFLVNVFVNALYTEIGGSFWDTLIGGGLAQSRPITAIIEVATIGFIFFLKFKLYKRAVTFTFKIFNA